jgi:hypothetical protein
VKKLLFLLALLSPVMVIAGEPDHFAICDKLMPDIAHSYDVYNLALVNNGSSYVPGEGVVLCVYDGVVRKFFGDNAVRVMATFNVASNKYNVRF